MRQSQTVSVSVRAGCAGRQRAVRQHCVACYVRTGAGAGTAGGWGGPGSLSSSSVRRNIERKTRV